MKVHVLLFVVVTSVIAVVGLACGPSASLFEPEIPDLQALPAGLDPQLYRVPDDNPITPEKVALGWQLFYDPRLSPDETISYASCHLPDAGFGGSPAEISRGRWGGWRPQRTAGN